MRKIIKLFILIIALILLLYVPISYAIEANFDFNINNDFNTNNQEQNKLEFFTVDSREKEIGSTLNMYINLSQIDYDVSKFTLISSNLIDNINTEGIEIKKENNEFSLIINKNELNIEQIILTYTISNNFKVGDKFTLTGKISEYKEEKIEDKKEDILQDDNEKNIENNANENDTENIEINVENRLNESDKENSTISIENNNLENIEEIPRENQQPTIQNEVKEVQIEITIVEKQEDEKEIENLKDNQNLNGQNKTEGFSQMENNVQPSVKYNTINLSNTETVVYNGSRNNYLETLSITNHEINTEFSKENTTYFLTVSNDITSIKITATKEDSSSKVCIYGNDDLKVGTNKVLISVTAENGDVRNYRIFVNREA